MRALDPRLLRRARPVRWLLGFDVALGLAAALLVLVQATLLARVIVRGFDGASLGDVTNDLALLALTIAARGVLAWGFEVAGARAASAALSELRLELVARRLRTQPASLDGVGAGEIVSAGVEGVDGLQAYFGRYLPQVVLACIVPLAVVGWVGAIDLTSALVMLVTLPLVPVFMWLIGRYTEERTLERWQALRLLSGHFLDVVRGLPTLQAFNRSRAQAAVLADVGERYRRTTMATLRVGFLSGSVLELAATLGVALVAVTVGVRLDQGGLGFQAALTVLVLAPELYLPLRRLAAEFHASANGLAVAERMLELLDAPAAVGADGRLVAPTPREAPVRFEGVSFAYPSRPGLVLTGFDLELAPGETVALVGPSGAGKSTVAGLLLRLLEPGAGRVTVGGIDLAECRAGLWRSQIAWVPQRPTIFRGTVADNIRLGAERAGDRAVRDAAMLAGADRFIRSLPEGYRTLVGDGGRALSAGERRRIALARAFLRDAPLVILDEPTADLDPISADVVAEGVERLCTGRTVLLIAHRPELVARADRVVALRRCGAGGGGVTRRLTLLASVPRARLLLAALLGALTILFGVGLMSTAGYLISRAAEHPAVLSLTAAIVGVRFFGLARPLARYLERLASHDVALRSIGNARAGVYERLERLSPTQLRGRRQGDLLASFVSDVDSLQNLYLRGLLPPVVTLVAGAGAVAAVAVILPRAALVLGAGLVVAGIVVPLAAAALACRSAALQAPARGALSAELVETLAGGAELVAYGRLNDRLERVRDADRTLMRAARRAALADGAGEGLRLLVMAATIAGVLAVAVSAHATGALDRILIAALALGAIAAFEAVQPLPEALREFRATQAAGERILDLTDREPVVTDPADPMPLPEGPFAVALEDVRVRYAEGERPALDGVSLRLGPGRRVALVGRSGSGKTTVANLLLRFLDPEAGRVTLAGRDLREYRQEDVRRAIAVAGQDSHLFSTTIRENVRLARRGATDEQIEDALRRARILDWVRSLPDGWNTLVGEEGRELSGGERQRLVVARALLANAPVLVLDEPTAHLDAPTAERLVDDVLDAAADRTVLLITHRPEGLDRMDEIVALAAG